MRRGATLSRQLTPALCSHCQCPPSKVCSPGGTTIAGIAALEQGSLRGTIINGVSAAVKRAEELSEP